MSFAGEKNQACVILFYFFFIYYSPPLIYAFRLWMDGFRYYIYVVIVGKKNENELE